MGQIKVAICGKFRSGKDTVGRHFIAEGFKRYAFGDKVREVSRLLYPEEFAVGKPREILQGVGQGLRTFDPDIWVKAVFNGIKANDANSNIIITDLRQPNEYEALRATGYVIIRVSTPDELRIKRCIESGDIFDPKTLTHDTESHVDSFAVDYEIINDGTLMDLFTETLNIITDLKIRRGVIDESF